MRATRLFLVYLALVFLAPFFSVNLFAQSCTDDDQDGWTTCDGDCDDADPSVHPGAPELPCDTIDNDCDPATPDIFDADGDGVDCSVDCDDSDPRILQGNVDPCDTIDNDCDGLTDEDEACDTTCDVVTLFGTAVLFDTPFIRFYDAVRTPDGFAAAYSTTNFPEANIFFMRADRSGNPIGTAVQINPPSLRTVRVAVAYTGSSYAVVWRASDSLIYFTRLDPFGNILETKVVANGASPRITWNGSEFGLVYQHFESNLTGFVRLDPLGNELGPSVMLGTSTTGIQGQPEVIWNGAEYAVVWGGGFLLNGLFFARIDTTGQVASSVMIAPTHENIASLPTIKWTGAEYAVAWETSPSPSTSRLYFASFDSSGSPIGIPFEVTGFLGDEKPQLEWTGTEFGFTWQRSDAIIHFKRLNAFGATISGLVQLGAPFNRENRQLYWNGTGFDSVWGSAGPTSSEGSIRIARLGCDCSDADNDGAMSCLDDCDDSNAGVYSGAPEICDGLANDCNGIWPTVPADEADADGDGHRICANDCNDSDPLVHPSALEICNGVDDDCDALVDEDAGGEDSDGDGIHNLCDMCPSNFDPAQADTDADGAGDACDNCPAIYNQSQSDRDDDGEGDRCDPDDAYVNLLFGGSTSIAWDPEGGTTWNLYRGHLGVLRSQGIYTQLPGSNPLAFRHCGLGSPSAVDSDLPAEGDVAFFLATVVVSGLETIGIGNDSDGIPRPHDNPCP